MLNSIAKCPNVENGVCDLDNNHQGCLYDGGDCCLEESDCGNCRGVSCVCHVTGQHHCENGDTQYCSQSSMQRVACFSMQRVAIYSATLLSNGCVASQNNAQRVA